MDTGILQSETSHIKFHQFNIYTPTRILLV